MNPYLLDVQAAMSAMPPAAPQETPVPFGPPASAAPAPPADWRDLASQMGPMPGVGPAPAPAAPPQQAAQIRDYGDVDAPGFVPPPAAAPQVAPGPPPAAEPQQAPAIQVASPGGAYGAREASRLGPTQWAGLADANAAQAGAIQGIAANNAGQAARDEDVYMQHALDARKREDAAGQVALQREDELRMRAADFDRQAKMLSQEKLDPGRFWASKSAPQKIASFISIALGGFLSGARGGENLALAQVNHEIDKDIRAQEIAYNMKRGGLEAAHTAYGMAMQRYQSADAARAFARVSAMDAVAAEIARQQAQGKGTESQNRALAATTELMAARADQLLKGIQHIPGGYVEPKYRVANRLGTYTAKEIDQQQIAPEEERGFKLQLEGVKAEGEIRKDASKYQREVAGKLKENEVVLPNGEVVRPPDVTEAAKLRAIIDATADTRRLVDEARKIRSGTTWRADPTARGRLTQIQTDLLQGYAVQHNMGALSDKDYENAQAGTADLFSLGPVVESKLDRLGESATAKLHARVRTYPGASPKAAGRMPGTFEEKK